MSKRPHYKSSDDGVKHVGGVKPNLTIRAVTHKFDDSTINNINSLVTTASDRAQRSSVKGDVEGLKLARDEYIRAAEIINGILKSKPTDAKFMDELEATRKAYLDNAQDIQDSVDQLESTNAKNRKENELDEEFLDEETIRRRNFFKSKIVSQKAAKDDPLKKEIIGLEDVQRSMNSFLKRNIHDPRLKGLGGKSSSNLLMYGPPGNGKTFLARTIAAQNNINFLNVKSSDLLNKWFGESEKFVADLFAVARENQPCIIFLDEVDTLAKDRSGADEASARVVNSFLQALDGFEKSSEDEIIVIAATNKPQDLDSAFLSRFDYTEYIPLPSEKDRVKIIDTLMLNKDFTKIIETEKKFDSKKIAKATAGYSNREIESILGKSLSIPVNEGIEKNVTVYRKVKTKDVLSIVARTKKATSPDDLQQFLEFKTNIDQEF